MPFSPTLPWALAVALVGAASIQGPDRQDPAPQDPAPQAPAPVDFARDVEPLLAKYCFRCHGEKKQKGDIRLDRLDPTIAARADAEGWHAALDVLQAGEMPPEDEAQPTDDERRLVTGWLRGSLAAAADRLAGERRVVLRRLTREQYAQSLQDLLGLGIDFGRRLPADAKSKRGFSNDGGAQQSSPLHLELYQDVAREALAQAIAVGEKPAVTRYRVTFGSGIGRGKVAGHTGGYQAVPLPTEDFTVELLDENGDPITGGTDEQRAARERIQRRISVGLRGSGQDRFRVVPEGMMLLSALPHREVVPQAWQGPSPNLKLEMQRCWPERGDFVMRVTASRGYVPPLRKQLLVGLDDTADGSEARPLCQLDDTGAPLPQPGALVLAALKSDQRKNVEALGDALVPVAVPEDSKARLAFELPADGFYQVDLVHAPKAIDAMPSVRLRIAGQNLDQRLHPTKEQLAAPRMVTPLGAIGMLKGRHHLEVGGPFFVGFTHVVVTPMPQDHPLVQRLESRNREQTDAVAHLVPSLRALIGTRTDDGMDYTTFGPVYDVEAELRAPRTYDFHGRLENLPIPEPESGDKEELSGFLLLGVWNDHLVKTPQETGPPLCVRAIEFEAPYLPQWPPASHTAIFFDSTGSEGPTRSDDDAYAAAVLERFVTRAFRRPAREDEVRRYVDFYRELRPSFASFEAAMQEVLVAVLCAPEFLFLCEPEDELADGGGLAGWMLANRLSYFLWNGPPDDELYGLATAGTLRQALQAQADRMLDDPRAWRFVRRFADEWLRLDRHETISIDVDRHRDYTRFVKRDMKDEVHAFLHHVLAADLPLDTLVRADFAMLNQNLAEFYGVPGVFGAAFRPVPIPATMPERRGGLLSHGAFLAGHSDGQEPHPIKRAVWLKARLLGDHPPAPPPNVPDLDPTIPGFDTMTLKQKIEAHRDKASCRDCHAGIDPYGFVFERLSAVGRFEPNRKGQAVDATAKLPDGTTVDGLEGLQQWLCGKQRTRLVRGFVEHLLSYALGRELGFADEAELDRLTAEVEAAGGRARGAVRAIVSSPSFLSK